MFPSARQKGGIDGAKAAVHPFSLPVTSWEPQQLCSALNMRPGPCPTVGKMLKVNNILSLIISICARMSTVPVDRMAYRKWKETKLQPGTAGPGNMLDCCFISFHFLWAILSTGTVSFWNSIFFFLWDKCRKQKQTQVRRVQGESKRCLRAARVAFRQTDADTYSL